MPLSRSKRGRPSCHRRADARRCAPFDHDVAGRQAVGAGLQLCCVGDEADRHPRVGEAIGVRFGGIVMKSGILFFLCVRAMLSKFHALSEGLP